MLDVELILKGKECLGDNVQLINNLWRRIFKRVFAQMYFYQYTNEKDLLSTLCKWANQHKLFSYQTNRIMVFSKAFCTHQKYVSVSGKRREFGDVTFLTMFSRPGRRVAYMNTFQLKVSRDFLSLLRNLDYSQLDFYRRELITKLMGPKYKLFNCDFLYYWMIKKTMPRIILEVPLSILWMKNSYNLLNKWQYSYPHFVWYIFGWNVMLRSLFLTTGVYVKRVLKFATPGFRDLLNRLLKEGVERVASNVYVYNGGNFDDGYELPEKPKKPELPEYPLDSSVVATEILFEKIE